MDREAAEAQLRQKGLAVARDTFARAAACGDVEVVRLFLAAGHDPAAPGPGGVSLLTTAVAGRQAGVVDAMLDHGADARIAARELARSSAPEGRRRDLWDRIPVLSGALAAVAVPILVGLIGARYTDAMKGREVAQKFVELAIDTLKVDPRVEGQTPGLRGWAVDVLAANSGLVLPEKTRQDLIKGPLPTIDRTLDALLTTSKSADDEERRDARSALAAIFLDAIQGGRRNSVQRMLDQKISPDTTDRSETSALTVAVLSDQGEMVDLLLRAGARRSLPNRFGDTPLIIGARDGRCSLLPKLLERMPAPERDWRNGSRDNALRLAIRGGHEACVDALLQAGAPVTTADAELAPPGPLRKRLRSLVRESPPEGVGG